MNRTRSSVSSPEGPKGPERPEGSSLAAHSLVSCLPEEQQHELSQLLDEYLSQLERGEPCDMDRFVAQHPTLAGPLREYLVSLQWINAAVHAAEPAQPRSSPASDCRQLGDYRLLREIGRGGMGIVYEAIQESLGRRVAVKVLPFAAVLDERQIARFQNEAQAAAQLDHPHIVPVHAVGCDRGVHFYSMQYIDGHSLDRIVHELKGPGETRSLASLAGIRWSAAEPKRVDPEPATPAAAASAADDSLRARANNSTVRIAGKEPTHARLSIPSSQRDRNYVRSIVELSRQAADALHYAHQGGVIHRDVKPSNLMVDRQGKLWITDFGLARLDNGRDLTLAGELVGTVRYMSPEQIAGKPHLIDHRTDIYSLGITLYELLTLQPAFPGEDRRAVMRSIEHDLPAAPRRFNPSIGTDLETIIRKAIAKQREDRYATAEEFAEDLNRYLQGLPTLARRPTVIDHVSRYCLRHARACAGLAALLLVGLIGLLAVTLHISQKNADIAHHLRTAELHLETAEQVVDRLGGQIAQQLEEVPGSDGIRQAILRESLAYYQSFARYAADNRSLDQRRARACFKLAALWDQLGELQPAHDAYQQAGEIFSRLVPRDHHPIDPVAEMSLCHINRGVVLVKQGRLDDAQHAYRLALSQLEIAAAAQPNTLRLTSAIALAKYNLGRLLCQQGDLADARSFLSAANQQLQSIPPSERQTPEVQLQIAAICNALAGLATLPVAEQEGYLRHAIEIYQKHGGTESDGETGAHELALCLNNLGSLLRRTSRIREAENCYREGIALQEELTTRSPHKVAFQAELATTLNNMAQIHLQRHAIADAESTLKRARELLESVCTRYPHQVVYRSSLGGVLHNHALLLEQQGLHEQAAEILRQAVGHQRFAYEQAPGDSRYRDFLKEHLANQARILYTLNQPAEARLAEVERDGI